MSDNRILPNGGSSTANHLGIVGNCPLCGAPIYGKPYIMEGNAAECTHSCKCREKRQSCLAKHPDLDAVCIRAKGHDGPHSRPWSNPSILEWTHPPE